MNWNYSNFWEMWGKLNSRAIRKFRSPMIYCEIRLVILFHVAGDRYSWPIIYCDKDVLKAKQNISRVTVVGILKPCFSSPVMTQCQGHFNSVYYPWQFSWCAGTTTIWFTVGSHHILLWSHDWCNIYDMILFIFTHAQSIHLYQYTYMYHI